MHERMAIVSAMRWRFRAKPSRAAAAGMQCFRNQRSIHWLALLALILQFILSFGHNHFDHGNASDQSVAGLSSGLSVSDTCPAPAHDDGDDDCPICQTMALVATAVVPAPPDVSIPVERTSSLGPLPSVEFSSHHCVSNFDARGPPPGVSLS